jgi:hypothetical protein
MWDWFLGATPPTQAAIVAGIVSLVLGSITAFVTIRVAKQNAALEREKIIFAQQQANKRPFLEKQLGLCFEATDAAARLASETDPVEWKKAWATFWKLYWGTLSVVENQAVENAMDTFVQSVPNDPVEIFALPILDLRMLSYDIAHAVRDFLASTWEVELAPIRTRTILPR